MATKALKTLLVLAMLTGSDIAQATIVEVTTNMGKFEINLFDQTTPVTVQNFLNYVNSGRYNGTVIHRSVPGFVIQGGGFIFDQQLPLKAVATNAAIINEPKWSNVRATIAMAKLGGDPNSATNQWFINLTNNAANLDVQNAGFTVFGQIKSQDMDVVDNIAGLPRFSFPGISELPLQNYSAADREDNKPLVAANLITIESMVVVDARPDSAATLNPVANTSATGGNDSDDSGGGSSGWLSLLLGLGLVWRRKRVI
ncbi:peptidylprolyl isomerase [Rheinheimera maricola]|uniref:Peptidyl-prolyl cis-trans isomerase n=1 Tax=Rheinheimera maricola TaxID=2793282 RepID=A0ABS7XC94_9GAMM|nr:peptidylprolyl isomerase [Rheinheimera maricola]MBZ9613189.1 peptidylprolyl isomerase [Rheinheimera maricola]